MGLCTGAAQRSERRKKHLLYRRREPEYRRTEVALGGSPTLWELVWKSVGGLGKGIYPQPVPLESPESITHNLE